MQNNKQLAWNHRPKTSFEGVCKLVRQRGGFFHIIFILYTIARIVSEWSLDTNFIKEGKKENILENLLTFYKYLNVRIPASLLTRKGFQWSTYKSVLEEVVGLMVTIQQLKEEPGLLEEEETLFSCALGSFCDENAHLDTGQIFCIKGNESLEVTSLQVQNEMKRIVDILEKYSTPNENWMNLEQVQNNLNAFVKEGQQENDLLNTDSSNELVQNISALWDHFSELNQILEDFLKHQSQLDALNKWKQSLPRLDTGLGKKIQKMVALLKPSLDILQENRRWNHTCSAIIQDSRKLERITRQMKLSEPLLLRLENPNNAVAFTSNEEQKENVVRNEL